jgi:hypothetical protein
MFLSAFVSFLMKPKPPHFGQHCRSGFRIYPWPSQHKQMTMPKFSGLKIFLFIFSPSTDHQPPSRLPFSTLFLREDKKNAKFKIESAEDTQLKDIINWYCYPAIPFEGFEGIVC